MPVSSPTSYRSPVIAMLAAYRRSCASDDRLGRERARAALDQAIEREFTPGADAATGPGPTRTAMQLAGHFASKQLVQQVIEFETASLTAPAAAPAIGVRRAAEVAEEMASWIKLLRQTEEAEFQCQQQAWRNRQLWPPNRPQP